MLETGFKGSRVKLLESFAVPLNWSTFLNTLILCCARSNNFFFQSVSTMDWPTEQVTSGKMDASTTVSVRMDTWDCTNVPRGERTFIYQRVPAVPVNF